MAIRLGLGLGITVVMLAIAGRRFFWLGRLITSGQPAVPSRVKDIPARVKAELVEVGRAEEAPPVDGSRAWPTSSPCGASPS